MPKATAALPSKLSLWMSMLLVWNIALLGIAIFFLFRLSQDRLSPEEIATACEQALVSQP